MKVLIAVLLLGLPALAARPKVPPQRNLEVLHVSKGAVGQVCTLIGRDSHPKEDELSMMYTMDPACDFVKQFPVGSRVVVKENTYKRAKEDSPEWEFFIALKMRWGIFEEAEVFELLDVNGITK